jgi:hypothetical protein
MEILRLNGHPTATAMRRGSRSPCEVDPTGVGFERTMGVRLKFYVPHVTDLGETFGPFELPDAAQMTHVDTPSQPSACGSRPSRRAAETPRVEIEITETMDEASDIGRTRALRSAIAERVP